MAYSTRYGDDDQFGFVAIFIIGMFLIVSAESDFPSPSREIAMIYFYTTLWPLKTLVQILLLSLVSVNQLLWAVVIQHGATSYPNLNHAIWIAFALLANASMITGAVSPVLYALRLWFFLEGTDIRKLILVAYLSPAAVGLLHHGVSWLLQTGST